MSLTNTLAGMGDVRTRLSMLWVFLSLNYVYGDVFTLLGKGYVVDFTPASLLGAAILVETPIVMVLLSWALKYRASRWANILVGAINVVATIISLTSGLVLGTQAPYNIFFAVTEIAGSSLILWFAWKWL